MKALIDTIKKDLDFGTERVRYTFLAAIISGIAAHGFMMFNKLSWHDDIAIVLNQQGGPLGRWLCAILTEAYAKVFGSNASMPLFNGVAALVILALGAILVSVIFELKHKADYIIVGSIMAVFPSVTCLFAYMWVAAYDALSILLSIIAVYALSRIKSWVGRILSGSVILCMSIGIYQAFINVTVFLLVILFLKNMMQDRYGKLKDIIIDVAVYIATLILGLLEYMIANSIFIKRRGMSLITYQGIDRMGKITLRQLGEGIAAAYRDFFIPIQRDGETMFMDNTRVAYYLLLGIIVILSVIQILRIFQKNKVHVILFAAVLLCIPLAYNFTHLLGAAVIYGIMVYAKCLIVVLCLVMLRYTDLSYVPVKKAMTYLSMAAMAFLILFYADFSNKCYLKATFQQEETKAWMTTLITQIKSIDGYKDEMKIAYINDREKQDLSSFEVSPLGGIYLIPYQLGGLNNSYNWKMYMKYWCGFNQAEVEDYTLYENDERIQNMPSYPDDGSIQIVDEVIIVKF